MVRGKQNRPINVRLTEVRLTEVRLIELINGEVQAGEGNNGQWIYQALGEGWQGQTEEEVREEEKGSSL